MLLPLVDDPGNVGDDAFSDFVAGDECLFWPNTAPLRISRPWSSTRATIGFEDPTLSVTAATNGV